MKGCAGLYALRPAWPDDPGALYLVGPDGVEIATLRGAAAAGLAARTAYLEGLGFRFGAQAILEAFALGHCAAPAGPAAANVLPGPWSDSDRDTDSGPPPGSGRSDALPAGCTRPAGCEGGGSDPGAGVSSLTSAAGGDAAGRLFSREATPYRFIQAVYGLTVRPGDRVQFAPYDMPGTVAAPSDAVADGGRYVAVVADGCGSPMACHPCDLVLLTGQGEA